jgi:hypothetical protein
MAKKKPKAKSKEPQEKQIDPFIKWVGTLAEGKGKSKVVIVKQLKEERGWPE